MTDVHANNQDFTRYDQVEKSHTYRLAEHDDDEFDEDYEIATLDFAQFQNGNVDPVSRHSELRDQRQSSARNGQSETNRNQSTLTLLEGLR